MLLPDSNLFNRRIRITVCGLFLTSILTACASTTEQVNDEVSVAIGQELPNLPVNTEIGVEEISWLDTFNDPALISLVAEALENNRNLQAAAASVDRARALAVQAGAALTPSVGLSAGKSRSGVRAAGTNPVENINTTVQISWELDLWGRIRSGSQAAVASFEAAEADYLFTRYSVAAATIKAYLIAAEANLQVDVTRGILESLEETYRIVELRYDNGLASALDTSLTRSDLATARERLLTIEGSQREALRALEVLLGRYPSAELEIENSLPNIEPIPINSVSSNLLQRRPDLVAAERRVAAAFNALDQAQAARLPSISLTSSVGGSSNALSSLLDGSNLGWQTGASLLAPLVDGGLLRAQIDIATAEQEQSILAYAQAALDAFSEVETFLDQGVVLQQRVNELMEATEETEEAFRIADLRYREGETDILDVLTIQNRVASNRGSLVTVRRALLEQRVNLYLALGGSWE